MPTYTDYLRDDAVLSINPADGSVLETYPFQTEAEVETVLQTAADAFGHWRWSSLQDRSDVLSRLADELDKRRENLARLIVLEVGKPINEAYAEVDKCAVSCRYFAQHGPSYLAPDQLNLAEAHAYVSYEPLGPVLAVMPWNFPIWQFVRFFITAVMAGNVSVLKHAENVQGSALALVEAVRASGAPEGLLQNLLVPRDQVAGVIADERIAGVTFTGSVAAGRIVAGLAGSAGKKSVLELGGSDPFIVLEDADLEAAVEVGVKARFTNTGQSCICSKRFIVADAVFDAFSEAFSARASKLVMGDPMQAETELGTIARADLRDALASQVEQTLSKGGDMALAGGAMEGAGYFYSPTVLVNVPEDSVAAREELFGPVATLFRARDVDEAIARANETRFGLGASLWTADLDRAEKLTARIEAGAVFVNDLVRSVAGAPFGGIKDSGFGRELGQLGTREFTNQKLVWINE